MAKEDNGKYSTIEWTNEFDPADYEWEYVYRECNTTVLSTIPLTDAEAAAYAARGIDLFPHLRGVCVIGLDNDEVEIHYEIGVQGFERIRRITGYLVGTLDRFNDAKRAEESQRVKHQVRIPESENTEDEA